MLTTQKSLLFGLRARSVCGSSPVSSQKTCAAPRMWSVLCNESMDQIKEIRWNQSEIYGFAIIIYFIFLLSESCCAFLSVLLKSFILRSKTKKWTLFKISLIKK